MKDKAIIVLSLEILFVLAFVLVIKIINFESPIEKLGTYNEWTIYENKNYTCETEIVGMTENGVNVKITGECDLYLLWDGHSFSSFLDMSASGEISMEDRNNIFEIIKQYHD